jgi:hypothetical protein
MNMRRLLRLVSVAPALALLAGLVVADRSAAAQALDLGETRACLCKEQQIGRLRQELEVRADARAEAEAQLADYDRRLAERYHLVDTGSELSVEQYKYIWEQRWALQGRLQRDLRPAETDAANRLNALVADYNATCANRTIIKHLADQARADLQCPMP